MVAVLARPPSVLFVAGEAGIGKTRLVAELMRATNPSKYRFTVGRCQPLREPFPYGPVFDCLCALAGRLAKAADLSPVAGVLAGYLPELAAVLPPPPPPPASADPNLERHRIFRAVRAVLSAIGPVVLVIEDLHWVDEDTAQLLRFLLSEPPAGLGLVLTYRQEDLGDRAGPLGGAWRPSAAISTVRIRLTALDVSEVRELATDLTGGQVSLGLAEQLHQDTAGIPFVVEEVLRTEGSDVPVPVRESTVERLSALSDEGRRIAQAAAVLEVAASVELLGEVAAVDRAAVVEALVGNVLVEVAENRYGFRHVFARRAVHDTLPGPERTEFHVRAVHALREIEPIPLSRIARHSRKAGLFGDWLRYGEAAVDRAIESADSSAAIGLLQELLAAPGLPAADVDRLATKFSRIAVVGHAQLDVTALLQRLLGDGRLSDPVRGEIRLTLGLFLLRQADGIEAARTELEQAVAELHERPRLAAKGMSVLATPLNGTVPLSEHVRWMRRVDQAIDHTQDKILRTTLLANHLGATVHTGDPEVWARIALLPGTSDSIEERRELARTHLNVADACSWTGHYDKALTHLWKGYRLAADTGATFIVSSGQATQVRLDWYTGKWAGLDERAAELLHANRELFPVTTELALVLGWLAVARGEWSSAEEHLARTGLAAPENAFTPVVIAAQAAMVSMLLARNEISPACAAVDTGLAMLRRKGVWSWGGELVPAAVAAYCAGGRVADAERAIDELRVAVEGLDTPLATAAIGVAVGLVAEHNGDHLVARDAFIRSRQRYDQLGLIYPAHLLTERIALCRLRLHEEDAADTLVELAQTLDELGASRDAARCRHVLRGLGTRCPSKRGRRGYGNDLSPREQAVAGLLARGHTNREIAEVLFLSRRTVEQHVAKVLRKLGLRSRRELQ
ncbi:LuxR family transcriptional regulator [Kutzneria viridogrisea]|uniref:HTH luxR-type domain-containing protein n=3 Tax=Pseudonocardiaceae TaxID=2070 RepID=W5WA08_9PSEU|nr:hypothetical protein KALB_4007 [Kutzneria albida DSM 43870]MBA8930711.1 DNA-binding CsgD family transcriptional regulator/tetratricopeptide (TPR) repeat protein [Kutzneria viridogrisea]